jgi:hypothetical protein
MSDRVWKDYTVETVVGSKRKPVEGTEDPTKACDAGWMDEGRIRPLTSELATKTYRRED